MQKFRKEILVDFKERSGIRHIILEQEKAMKTVFGSNAIISHNVLGHNPPSMSLRCETHYEDYLRCNEKISIQFQVEYK